MGGRALCWPWPDSTAGRPDRGSRERQGVRYRVVPIGFIGRLAGNGRQAWKRHRVGPSDNDGYTFATELAEKRVSVGGITADQS